ncbi:MAG TPA: histidine phosphatase family protein [Dehalococcoidia bacterium]|nr:histidine phosphatase family protein [Dehalococcoidia bacterium]
MRLLLVRHGESVGNSENRLQGQAEYDLTDLGRRQAEATGRRLAEMGVTAVYSSPLRRAQHTAQACAAHLGIEARLDEALSEYHFGEMSGSTYQEVRERLGVATAPAERVYPGEEGRDNFFARVTTAVWRIADEHAGETVAVISHGGPIALFCQSVLGLPYKRPMPFVIGNASICAIDVNDDANLERANRSVLTRLNDAYHLRGI